MAYQAIIFDLDDTLFDFRASEDKCLEHIHGLHFAAHIAAGAYKDHYHHINKALWGQVELGELMPSQVKTLRFSQLINKLGLSLDHLEVAMAYETAMGEAVIWLPGAEQALAYFKAHFTLGIITNGLTSIQTAKCHKAGVYEWAKCVIISEQVGLSKPDPRIFSLAMKEMNVSAQDSLMVGDSLTGDFRGALNSGMDFCWVNPDNKPLPEGFPKPKYQVRSVAELPALLQK